MRENYFGPNYLPGTSVNWMDTGNSYNYGNICRLLIQGLEVKKYLHYFGPESFRIHKVLTSFIGHVGELSLFSKIIPVY